MKTKKASPSEQPKRTRTGDVLAIADQMRVKGIKKLSIDGKFTIELGELPQGSGEPQDNTDAFNEMSEQLKKIMGDDDLLFHST